MDLKLQRIAAWGGIAMLALFFVFFMLIAKLIPPLSPTLSAQSVADFLIANKLRVRVGVAFTLLAACVALPWLATICLRVRRVEGKWGGAVRDSDLRWRHLRARLPLSAHGVVGGSFSTRTA